MPLPIRYNWQNLLARRLSTALTFVVVAVVVAVFSILLSFAAGIHASLQASGSESNVIVLKTGATAESTSILSPEEVGRIIQAPGIAKNAAGQLLVSPEQCVQTSLARKNQTGLANIAVRGVDQIAFDVHTEVKILSGRRIAEAALEVIVGRQAHERYAGLNLGDDLLLGRTINRAYKVVGIFDAAGGALECEIWAPRTQIADSYHRRFDSSVVLRVADAARAADAISYIKGPAVRLLAKRETDYYLDLSSKTREIVGLTSILITIMGIGAMFAVANTMYAAVDSRKREIAILRTIGFSRSAIVVSFMMESLMICLGACAVGIVASLLVNGSRKDYLSDSTWTVLAYELRVTPTTIAAAIGVALVVGVVGAAAPALRASRTRILEALRKA
jgi:ABC-type lipoprotein release transport system permease subunit